MSKSGGGDDGTPFSQSVARARRGGLNRRQLLTSSAGLLPLVNLSCSTALPPPAAVLTPQDRVMLDAFADRIVPPDASGPGAAQSGVTTYIERSLADWNQADLPLLRDGLRQVDATARAQYRLDFATLPAAQQDELLLAMEAGQLAGFDEAQAVFNRLHRLVLEGMFSDPWYGGNANFAGWDLIGYPGAVLASTADMQQMGSRLPLLHTSAYGAEHDGALTSDGAGHSGD